MKDMNFFSEFHPSRGKRTSQNIGIVILTLLAVLLILVPVACYAQEMMLKVKAEKMQTVLSAPENKAALEQLQLLKDKLAAINKAEPELSSCDQILAASEWITEDSLRLIIDAIPKQISANIMAMADGSVQINGVSVDKPAIAELEYNLRTSGVSDSIHIFDITLNESGRYAFNMNFMAKDVNTQ